MTNFTNFHFDTNFAFDNETERTTAMTREEWDAMSFVHSLSAHLSEDERETFEDHCARFA